MRRLRPPDPQRTSWIAPPDTKPLVFEPMRRRLERLAARGPEACYEAKRRALHRCEDAELGAVAIKEVRSEGLHRALWFRRFAEHPGLREFHVGATFAARGGATPAFFGAAIERDPLRVHRVLIFLRWLDGAEDLERHLERTGADPDPELLARVAAALVRAARLGLVHGRHSPGNLLLQPRGGGVEVLILDFAYSSLGEGLDERGLAEDVARLGHRLIARGLCSRDAVGTLLDLTARAASDDAEPLRARFEERLEARVRSREP